MEIYNGRVDILVNAAGALNRCAAFEVLPDDWNEVIELNLNAVFFMSQRLGSLWRPVITERLST